MKILINLIILILACLITFLITKNCYSEKLISDSKKDSLYLQYDSLKKDAEIKTDTVKIIELQIKEVDKWYEKEINKFDTLPIDSNYKFFIDYLNRKR